MADFRGDPIASLYSAARDRGWRSRVWSTVSRRSRRLLSLAEVNTACTVVTRRAAGLQTVATSTIRGSETRCNDFDCQFNPLQDHTGGRWRRVAKARLAGKNLPPVELVQVGDTYFVRDGHHRISVARALGQRHIEAEVTVWQVAGSLPWEGAAGATRQEPAIKRLFSRVRDRSAQLRDQLMLGLDDLLISSGMKPRARQASKAHTGSL